MVADYCHHPDKTEGVNMITLGPEQSRLMLKVLWTLEELNHTIKFFWQAEKFGVNQMPTIAIILMAGAAAKR